MTGWTVRHAAADDVGAVFDLSRAHRDTSDGETGFLVSDFSVERYRAFQERSGPPSGGGGGPPGLH